MLESADILLLLLFLGMFSMALLAAFYLRGRSLSSTAYLGWGALLIFLPVLGPFLVILLRPGSSRKEAESKS